MDRIFFYCITYAIVLTQSVEWVLLSKKYIEFFVRPPFPWQQTKMATKHDKCSIVWKHCNSTNNSDINVILSVFVVTTMLCNHREIFNVLQLLHIFL